MLAPFLDDGEREGATVVEAAITAYRDETKRSPADNHAVTLSLGGCPPLSMDEKTCVGADSASLSASIRAVTDHVSLELAPGESEGYCQMLGNGASVRCFMGPSGVAAFGLLPGAFETTAEDPVCLCAESGASDATHIPIIVSAGLPENTKLVAEVHGCDSGSSCHIEPPKPGQIACTTGASCTDVVVPISAELVGENDLPVSVNFSLRGDISLRAANFGSASLAAEGPCDGGQESAALTFLQHASHSNTVQLCLRPVAGHVELTAALRGVEVEVASKRVELPDVPYRLTLDLLGQEGIGEAIVRRYRFRGETCAREPVESLEAHFSGEGLQAFEADDGKSYEVLVASGSEGKKLFVDVPEWDATCSYDVP